MCNKVNSLRGLFTLFLEQINFEMRSISKFSFSRKMRFSAESTPRCGALHESAALEHLHFFQS
ncbi:hypothetical protein KL86DES1_20232 [uncultured Desulfovibrio sp.]|uniref:Uncharacterized protein n=1 Tax=uncultured Desulfovibrio sp. TaxID=167968 RepID=A0A212L399_9BACT|nr:hypothetical protein KL86DES1_20232 [uncultured Desulfovibrio sp.]VZH33133.1 conserved protein of unknown function [Desulfovibrio sp. 86]